MALPSGHPWENTPPTVSDEYFFGAWIGASNLPVGSQDSNVAFPYNTDRNLLYKHNDTLAGFSDPPNSQSVATYSRFDETGTQNIVSFFSEKVREKTNRKIATVTGGQSATGLSNQITGFDSPTSITQMTDLFDAAKALVGKGFDYAVINGSDGDMRFNPTAQQITDLITDYVSSVRTAAGNANLPIFIRLPGLTPPSFGAVGEGGDGTYPTWTLHNTTLKTLSITGVHLVDTDSLAVATRRESDEVHGNALGNQECADLIIDEMVTAGLLPQYD